MKIWKATLSLCTDIKKNYVTVFTFFLQEDEYKENTEHNEWIHYEEWGYKRIPINMSVESFNSAGISIEQGFDHELNQEEQKSLELNMRRFMREKLECYKENYLKDYEKRLSVVKVICYE